MREIKFRAWDGKKMIQPDTMEGSGSSSEMYVMDFRGRVSLINYYGLGMKPIEIIPGLTIMQFTGLQDKNGKDIYEGDILEYEYNRDTKTTTKFTEVVEYDDNIEGNGAGFYIHKSIRHQIIGNIYENHELITQ